MGREGERGAQREDDIRLEEREKRRQTDDYHFYSPDTNTRTDSDRQTGEYRLCSKTEGKQT